MNTLKISLIKFVIQPSKMLNNILLKGSLNQINKFIQFLNKKKVFVYFLLIPLLYLLAIILSSLHIGFSVLFKFIFIDFVFAIWSH